MCENYSTCSMILVLKSSREKEEDLVATGILFVILDRQVVRLSYHSALPSDPVRHGYKTFENLYRNEFEEDLICGFSGSIV